MIFTFQNCAKQNSFQAKIVIAPGEIMGMAEGIINDTLSCLEYLIGDNMIVDPIYNEEAFLVFHQLHIEVFRKHRFGHHFTHLSYDCKYKWAYAYMPATVAIALASLVVLVGVVFVFRYV